MRVRICLRSCSEPGWLLRCVPSPFFVLCCAEPKSALFRGGVKAAWRRRGKQTTGEDASSVLSFLLVCEGGRWRAPLFAVDDGDGDFGRGRSFRRASCSLRVCSFECARSADAHLHSTEHILRHTPCTHFGECRERDTPQDVERER